MSYLPTIILSLMLHVSDATYGMDRTDSTKTQHHKMTITEALDKYTDKWMKIPGIIGTGEGKSDGKPCILVMTNGNTRYIKKKIPKTVEGYKVVFEETGEIKARQ